MKPLEIFLDFCDPILGGDLEITDRVDHALGQLKWQTPQKPHWLVRGVLKALAGAQVDSFQTDFFGSRSFA